jgi:tetratricopeptide (TPR) repeat protein
VASYLGIASNLNYMGDYEAARNKISELLSIARNDGERRAAYNAMAVSYVDEGNLDKALENINVQYELAKKINDKAAMSGDLAQMGNIYFEMDKTKEALEHYNSSVQMADAADMSPELKENIKLGNFYSTGSCAMKNGKIKIAKKDCEEFMKGVTAINNPNQIRLAHQLRAMILMSEENYEGAEKELKQANLQNPYNLYRLALVYNKLDNSEKAKEYCVKAANFNALTNIQYSFIRNKAKKMSTEL